MRIDRMGMMEIVMISGVRSVGLFSVGVYWFECVVINDEIC